MNQNENTPRKLKIQPSMYRVFKSTVQRVPVNIKSLSSRAAFLIIMDGEKQVIAWIGSDCESTDSDLIKELGVGVMTKDYRLTDTTEIPVILEGSEPVPLLDAILDIFWSNSNTYFSKVTSAERRQKITNNSVSVGLIEKLSSGSEVYDFQETAFAHPDARGTVPRVTFAPIELKTTAYVNVGDQWDLWISRGVSEEEERSVMAFLEGAISSQIALESTAFKKEVLSQYIQVVRQGEERFLFRRPLKIFTDFEPPGKTAPRLERTRASLADSSSRAGGEESEEKKVEEAAAGASSSSTSKPCSPRSPLSGKGVSFFGLNVETGVTDQDGVDLDDEDSGAPKTPPPPHVYVDFYSVHSQFHHGHMEHKTTGEIELSLNDIELIAKRGLLVPTATSTAGANDPSSSSIPVVEGISADGYGSSYAALSSEPPVAEESVGVVAPLKVTADMLKLDDKLNLSVERRAALIKESATNPQALLGYQVEIDEGVFAGLFVVTKVKKTLFHKTLFYLSATDGDEFWLRLQRGPGKKGQKFRPLRKVLNVPSAATSSTNSYKGLEAEPTPLPDRPAEEVPLQEPQELPLREVQ